MLKLYRNFTSHLEKFNPHIEYMAQHIKLWRLIFKFQLILFNFTWRSIWAANNVWNKTFEKFRIRCHVTGIISVQIQIQKHALKVCILITVWKWPRIFGINICPSDCPILLKKHTCNWQYVELFISSLIFQFTQYNLQSLIWNILKRIRLIKVLIWNCVCFAAAGEILIWTHCFPHFTARHTVSLDKCPSSFLILFHSELSLIAMEWVGNTLIMFCRAFNQTTLILESASPSSLKGTESMN